ncbi:hypothetical protein QBC43DRAFT_337198 [Cladorrhinum sp. PSN259]|nr:hypothetical protein QBC43DRAFT_337198 [Cladorrhinum sp. PSN259]
MPGLGPTSIMGSPVPTKTLTSNDVSSIKARKGGGDYKGGIDGERDRLRKEFQKQIDQAMDEKLKIELGRQRDQMLDELRNGPNLAATARTSASEPQPATTSQTVSTTSLAETTTSIPQALPNYILSSIGQVNGAASFVTSTSSLAVPIPLEDTSSLAIPTPLEDTSSFAVPTPSGKNPQRAQNPAFRANPKVLGPGGKAAIAIGSITCFFIILACSVYVFRRLRGGESRYGSRASYVSRNKTSSSRPRSRTSRDMEETLLEDELEPRKGNIYNTEIIEKPKPAVSRWMSEVYRHQLTDPDHVSVSFPLDGARSQGQPADLSDVSSLLTTAVTHTTHSTNGNFKPRTALRHPNPSPIGAALTQPFDPTFEEQSPVHNHTPSIPLAARLSGVGVSPSDAYLDNINYNRDSIGSRVSSMSAAAKRRSI